MSNLVHHVLAAAWSFALVAGVLTLCARLWLDWRLDQLEHPAQFDSPAVYMALVAPGLLPLVWLVSGLVHLEDSGALMQACCSFLALSEPDWPHWLFGAGAAVLAAIQGHSLFKTWRPSHRAHPATALDAASERVRQVCGRRPRLDSLAGRIDVVDCGAHICATVGLFKQRIEIADSLVQRLDDDALEAALLHEVAHLSVHDPARGFFLLVSRVINPFSWALSTPRAAWHFAREIACDSHAVDHGARPVSVADAIVTAVKASTGTPGRVCARLCGTPADALSARINLLLSGENPRGIRRRAARVPAIGSLILTFGLIVPHLLGASVISMHCLLEETLATLTFLF